MHHMSSHRGPHKLRYVTEHYDTSGNYSPLNYTMRQRTQTLNYTLQTKLRLGRGNPPTLLPGSPVRGLGDVHPELFEVAPPCLTTRCNIVHERMLVAHAAARSMQLHANHLASTDASTSGLRCKRLWAEFQATL